MIIRNNELIPGEVESFLLDYEASLDLDKDMEGELELIRITNTDVFEGVLIYWKDDRSQMEVVTWNSWYHDLPTLYNLMIKPEGKNNENK